MAENFSDASGSTLGTKQIFDRWETALVQLGFSLQKKPDRPLEDVFYLAALELLLNGHLKTFDLLLKDLEQHFPSFKKNLDLKIRGLLAKEQFEKVEDIFLKNYTIKNLSLEELSYLSRLITLERFKKYETELRKQARASFDAFSSSEPKAHLYYLNILEKCKASEEELVAAAKLGALKSSLTPAEIKRLFDKAASWGALGFMEEIHQRYPKALRADQVEKLTTYREMVSKTGFRIPHGKLESPLLPTVALCRLPKSDIRQEPVQLKTVALLTWGLGPGGAERQVVNTLRALHQLNPQLKLILIAKHLKSTWQKSDFYLSEMKGLPVKIVELGDAHKVLGASNLEIDRIIKLFPESLAKDISAIATVLQDEKVDLLHCFQDSMNLLGAWAGLCTPTVRVLMCGRNESPDKIDRKNTKTYMKDVYKELLRNPKISMAHNSHNGKNSYASWLGVPAEKFQVIYNGLYFSKTPSTAPGSKASFVVGSVFRFHEQKNPWLWFEVVKRLLDKDPRISVVCVGHGPLKEQIEKAVHDCGLAPRVSFLSYVNPLGPLYAEWDVFLATSLNEGLPNVVIEAQAAGLPVVATWAGGTHEVVDEGRSGFVLKRWPLEPLSLLANRLVAKILWIKEHEQWKKEAQTHAQERMQRLFSIEAMGSKTLEVYQACLLKG